MQLEALSAIRVLRDPGSGVTRRRGGACSMPLAPGGGRAGRRPDQGAIAPPGDCVCQNRCHHAARIGAFDPGIHVRDLLDSIAARDPQLIQKFWWPRGWPPASTLESARLDQFASAFDAECGRALARLGSPDVIETDGETGNRRAGIAAGGGIARRRALGPGFFPSRCSTACSASNPRAWWASATSSSACARRKGAGSSMRSRSISPTAQARACRCPAVRCGWSIALTARIYGRAAAAVRDRASAARIIGVPAC